MCKPAPLMFCIWRSRLEELQLICSAQSSKAQRTQTASFLPKEEPSSSSSASRRPQICPSCGGGELASRKEIKQRPAGTRMQWKELAAKTGTASSPKEFFWQRTWLASVCSGLSEQKGPQILPCQSKGAPSCPSSTVEHNQQVSALRWELEVFTPPAQHLTRQESLVTHC